MPKMLPAFVTTKDQLLQLREPGCRHELVRGELRRMSNAGWWHGAIAARLCCSLQQYVDTHRSGLVFAAETGFWVEREPDTVRAPDAAFVRTERIPPQPTRGYFEGAPDLAVEVTSPNDTYAEVHEKALAWLAYGATVVWVVEPMMRRIAVYRSDGTIQALTAFDDLRGDDLLPGFCLRLADLFADPL